jgi:ferredoxin
MVHNQCKGEPPIVLYPDECWFCGCCVDHCPSEAIELVHPVSQRACWKRKDTGEFFRIGMHDPPPPNERPPVGGW